ncbi:MAG: LysR family transcriptional regulator [Proteobacteria bacterium]|nr:LysR family transcriptional regulator [Pseudomonadota bacterium]
MSHFSQIAAFIAVVEQSSFAAAARQFNVSTAAISRQVARLEADLHIQLLYRTTRRVALTEVGAEYYQQCKKALEGLAEAERTISASQAMATGILNITSSRYFALQYLLPRLPKFLAENPKLHIKIELAERFPDLEKENIDLIFGMSMPESLDLVRKRVATTRYVLCAAPQYLKKYPQPKTPEDMHRHRYLAHSMRQPDNVLVFKNSREVTIQPFLRINDSQALRDCAIQSMGVVQLHDYLVADALKDGRLIELLKNFSQLQQPIYLYYKKNRYLQPKIRNFIDFYTN